MRRIVVIGATSLIAQHVLRLWVSQEAADLHLVGRDVTRLEAVAGDLLVRSPESRALTHTVDVLDPAAVEALADTLCSDPVDMLLIAHGSMPPQADAEADRLVAQHVLRVNGESVVLCLESFLARMDPQRPAHIVVIGSVAGDRGRGSNYVYGAAKAMVATYVAGAQHRLAGSALRITLVKPGPTATPMTAGMSLPMLAAPDRVAADIVRAAALGRPVVYAPRVWGPVMFVLRHLPRAVFHRLRL